ncbi:ROK family protein [Embleya scabrispora]|uniref:ROK family protein n=1 Tax=Embleya scabrispora TaxID=159449 RepID=UPI001F24880F|nr:ROK family protein [Embleya scabrispora]
MGRQGVREQRRRGYGLPTEVGRVDPGGAGGYLYLSGETGIGAGIVVEGELFRGAHGAAGELGHGVVDPRGPACRCGGTGCPEQVAGLDALLRTGVPDAAGPSESRLAELTRLHDHDRDALHAVGAAGRGPAVALVGAVNLLDPDTIVLGGLHARLAPWLIPPIEAALAPAAVRCAAAPPPSAPRPWRRRARSGAPRGPCSPASSPTPRHRLTGHTRQPPDPRVSRGTRGTMRAPVAHIGGNGDRT